MSEYSRVDVEHWARKEHYRYYTERLPIAFTVTVPVHVEQILDYCHRQGKRFYPSFIAVITEAVNSMENFRMFRDEAGQLCLWQHVIPNYTIFHHDDHTFSDCWSPYDADFEVQYNCIVQDMNTYQSVTGIKAKPNQPANFFCVSCAPWMSFTSFNSVVSNREPQFFPIITAGKYERTQEQVIMPVAFTIAHAVCDGYHAGLFFERLQQKMDTLGRIPQAESIVKK